MIVHLLCVWEASFSAIWCCIVPVLYCIVSPLCLQKLSHKKSVIVNLRLFIIYFLGPGEEISFSSTKEKIVLSR